MRFFSYQHEKNFNTLIQEDNTHPQDKERYSLFYILSGNSDLFRKRHHIYDFADSCIIPECLTNGVADFCSSSKALIRLGFNLYNSYEDEYTSPIDILCNLDEQNYNLAIQSLNIRFGMSRENEIDLEDEPEEEYDMSL